MPIQLFVEEGVVIPARAPNELLNDRLPPEFASRTPVHGPFQVYDAAQGIADSSTLPSANEDTTV